MKENLIFHVVLSQLDPGKGSGVLSKESREINLTVQVLGYLSSCYRKDYASRTEGRLRAQKTKNLTFSFKRTQSNLINCHRNYTT